jgi:integrase-like protein
VPIEADLLSVIEDYLDSRPHRFPTSTKSTTAQGLSRRLANAPLFEGRDGERITRGTIQSRVRRAFRRAGPDAQPVRGALMHGLRHTYATELANSEVSVYTLMKLLGHESMATSQRYVTGAAGETRTAAAQNPLHGILFRAVIRLHAKGFPDAPGCRTARLLPRNPAVRPGRTKAGTVPGRLNFFTRRSRGHRSGCGSWGPRRRSWPWVTRQVQRASGLRRTLRANFEPADS